MNTLLDFKEEDLILLSKFHDILKNYSEEFSNRLVEVILSKEETRKLIEGSGVLKDDERAKSLISKVSEFYLSIFSGDREEIKEWFSRIAKTHFKNLIPPEYVISLSSFIVDFTIEKLINNDFTSDELIKVNLALNHILNEGISLISYIFYKSLIKILGIRRDLLIKLAKYGAEKL